MVKSNPPMRPCLLLALVTVAVSAGGPATAADRGDVVILRSSTAPDRLIEATNRLQAELRAGGFVVRIQERLGRSKVLAYEAGAVMQLDPAPLAALSVYEDEGELAAALWRVDAQTGKPTAWRVSVRDDSAAPATGKASPASVLAVRAVELLHASLTGVELDAPKLFPAPPAPAPATITRAANTPAPAATATAAQSFARGFSLGAGVMVLQSIGGVGPAAAPAFSLGVGRDDGLMLRLSAAGLGSWPVSSAPEGTAAIRQDALSADGGWVFRRGETVQPLVFAGAGAYHARVIGDASAPYRGLRRSFWSVLARAGVGAAYRITPATAVLFEAEALLAFPALRVRIVGDSVATAGRPTLAARLSLLASF